MNFTFSIIYKSVSVEKTTHFEVPYINNCAYILQFICTFTAKGHLHILRPAWVIILSALMSHTTQAIALHFAVLTTLQFALHKGEKNCWSLLLHLQRNCQVSISSAINFSGKQVLSSFLLPSSFSSLFKSTKMETVEVQSCVVLSQDLCSWVLSAEELGEVQGLCGTPLPCLFPTGNAAQGQQGHGKKSHNGYL